MSELETRLAAFVESEFGDEYGQLSIDGSELLYLLRNAARIGAEIEREECAAAASKLANWAAIHRPIAPEVIDTVIRAIRARGGK